VSGSRRSLAAVLRGALSKEDTSEKLDLHREHSSGTRQADPGVETAAFYDLVTDFYEYGWGQSFHFAPRKAGEALAASIARLERFVAEQGGFDETTSVLDAGCGVGGPMRTIARTSGCSITGVTINAYQVERARRLNDKAGLGQRCRVIQGDFTRLPQQDRTFDGACTFEAVCHAGDRAQVFGELFRVLKPGSKLVGTDWCTTDRYDPANPRHAEIRDAIAEGNGLAPLIGESELTQAILDAGFELIERRDLAGEGEIPWYQPLQGRGLTLQGLTRSRAGRWITHRTVRVVEGLRLAPQGTTEASAMLNRAADALVAGGELGIFTPLSFFAARRP
jgi:sterol 24-C-methyltransferase